MIVSFPSPAERVQQVSEAGCGVERHGERRRASGVDRYVAGDELLSVNILVRRTSQTIIYLHRNLDMASC